MQASLGVRKDGLHLYRSMVPPAVPSLAFLGCETSSPYSWLTTSLQAAWVAALAAGRLQLPGLRTMKEDVFMQRRWGRGRAGQQAGQRVGQRAGADKAAA